MSLLHCGCVVVSPPSICFYGYNLLALYDIVRLSESLVQLSYFRLCTGMEENGMRSVICSCG